MKNLHVAVTGASSGFGEAIVREFSNTGARVSLIARRTETLRQIALSLPNPSAVFSVDLSDVENCTSWIEEAEIKMGPIDILVNNAGMQMIGRTDQIPLDEGMQLMRLNLLTPLHLTQIFLSKMIARNSGTIINVASLASLAPTPGLFHYNASKAGLAAASEALRGELKGTGVKVITVYPGVIPTQMAHNAFKSFGESVKWLPTGNTTELSKRIRIATEMNTPRVIYPRIYSLARHFPALTRIMMDRFTPTPGLR